MPTMIVPSSEKAAALCSSRRAGWSGATFVVLLLLTAGMASVPGGTDSVSTVRTFYGGHTQVVVVAQLVGLVAAAAFAVHARGLATVVSSRRSTVSAAGTAVAGSAALTAVPVLVLAGTVERAPDRLVVALARASDWTDVVLFIAMSLFAAALARASTEVWVAAMGGSVVLLSTARAVLLARGSDALSVAAPVVFLALITAISIRELVTARRRGQQTQALPLRKDRS